MLVNCQSLVPNLSKIKILANDFRPFIVCLTETRTTRDILDAELTIDGYFVNRSDSMSRHSGGVVLYCRKDVKFTFIFEKQMLYDNFLICDIFCDNFNGRFILIYHSPNQPHADFLDELEELLDQYVPQSRSFNILGDFNLCMKKLDNPHSRRLLNIMKSYGLKLRINGYTRIARGSKSCIDLFFTNNELFDTEIIEDDMIADHQTIRIMKKEGEKSKNIMKTIVDRSKYKPELMKQEIRKNFDRTLFCSLGMNEKFEYLVQVMNQSMNKFVEIKQINIRFSKPWYDDELRNLRLERNWAGLRAHDQDTEESWAVYRHLKNKYNRMLTRKENANIKNEVIEAKEDPKKMWRILKSYMSNKQEERKTIETRNGVLSDDTEIAEAFNNYFIQSIIDIKETIPALQYEDQIDSSRLVTKLETFTEVHYPGFMTILKNMKKKLALIISTKMFFMM